MEKRNLLSFLRRVIPCFSALFVLLFTLCFTPGIVVHANVANGAKHPDNWAPLQFDSIFAQKASNGFNYYLDWPLNSFTGRGFNLQADYDVVNGASGVPFFSIAGTPYIKDLTADFDDRQGVECNLICSHDWSTYDGTVNLYADQMFIPRLALDQAGDSTSFYYVWFGNGAYKFNISISFDINFVVREGPLSGGEYRYTINRTNANIHTGSDLYDVGSVILNDPNAGQEIWAVDLLTLFYHLIFEYTPVTAYSDTVFLTNVLVSFWDVRPDSELSFSPLSGDRIGVLTKLYFEDAYSGNGSIVRYPASNFQFFFDDLQLYQTVVEDVTIVESEFPSDWTGWLANALEGFFDFEFAPGLSLGLIFASVFGVLMLWFLLHLFM